MNMKKSEIWRINLDPTVGAEIKKKRPVVIVNDDRIGKLPLKVVIPITDWKPYFSEVPWMVKIDPDKSNGLYKTSAADAFQIRSVSEGRFIEKLGELSLEVMEDITDSLAVVFICVVLKKLIIPFCGNCLSKRVFMKV